MANESRVSTAVAYAVAQGDTRRISTALAYAAVQGDTRRVSTVLAYAVGIDPSPIAPTLIAPVQDGVYSDNLYIAYTEVVDPLGGAVTYSSRMKLTTDTVWTDIFVDYSGTSYVHDIAGYTDGTYDFQLWAETAGYSSPWVSITFVIHDGVPTAPVITAPYEGQEWEKQNNTVMWDAATDPDLDPLTYSARYKKTSASSWTSLFTGESGLSYVWNQTTFDVDDYELEVWANDGTGDGPHAHVYFSIDIVDEPDSPRIKVVAIGNDSVTVELDAYTHPFDRAWQATLWEMIPWGGNWSNPVFAVTSTAMAEQLTYTFTGLPSGFRGIVRATFQDNLNTWGDPSAEAFFVIPETQIDWSRRWERNADWGTGGLGVEGRSGDWGPGLHEQPVSGIVDPDTDGLGSFFMEGYIMAGGCYCGWIGKDTELRYSGIGIFVGDSETGGQYSVHAGIHWATSTEGVAGAHICYPYAAVRFKNCAVTPSAAIYGSTFTGYVHVVNNSWLTTFTHYPIYQIQLWVQRNLSAATTRIRMRVNYVGTYSSGFPSASIVRKSTAQDGWDIDQTLNCISECGAPGFWMAQLAQGFKSAFTQFFGLSYRALRDDGQAFAEAVEPLEPYVEPDPGECVAVTEDPLAAPVFFPVPPNGDVEEDWDMPSDVITSRDDSEQRINLREIAVQKVTYTTSLLTTREITQLRTLLFEDQPARWGVPMWMDAARLDVTLASGAGTIPAASFDSVGRRFASAQYVAIWVDQFTYDFLPATFNPDGSITLTGTTSRTYEAFKSYVIPCRIGRMADTAEFDRFAPEMGDYTVTFVLEAVDG